jgi:hypothetical protein
LLLVLLEAAQDGVGDLAVHLDVPFPGRCEGVRRFGGGAVPVKWELWEIWEVWVSAGTTGPV